MVPQSFGQRLTAKGYEGNFLRPWKFLYPDCDAGHMSTMYIVFGVHQTQKILTLTTY
jgi:hypothetical protein